MSGLRRSIGKRLRFAVFKRDKFTCQYCGATPPKVVLEIDHIVPVNSGGDNHQDNLVTACFNCNRGKAHIPLSVSPPSLSERAAEIKEKESQLAGLNDILSAQRERLLKQCWEVVYCLLEKDELPYEFFNSIEGFVKRLGVHEVMDACRISRAAGMRTERSLLLYFCKTCWNKIRVQDGF